MAPLRLSRHHVVEVVSKTLIVVIAVMAGAHGTEAKTQECLTRSEAKKLYRGAYLYWHRNANRQRCWSSQRPGRAPPPARRQSIDYGGPPTPPAAPPPVMLPHGLMPPQHALVAPPSILDSPRWAWVAEARAAHDDAGPYSTFASGAEPDVWPQLPAEPVNRGGIVVVVMSGLFAMALGLALWRWQLGRLRIAKLDIGELYRPGGLGRVGPSSNKGT